MLILTRKKDEKIMIGDEIEITVVDIEGGQVQLGIEAPREIDIYREEIYKEVKEENIEAIRKQLDISQLEDLQVAEDD
ncbi:MAG: carbon storage regulator CsrA [bacterium]